MPKNNSEIAAIFYEIADILDIQDVEWKPRAYREAALFLESYQADVREIYHKGGLKALEELPGIGEGLGKKIVQFLEKGKIDEYEKLKKSIPKNLEILLKIPGMGPKKAKKLFDALNVKTICQLEKAAKGHRIAVIPGFGEKSEKEILESIAMQRQSKSKIPYEKAKRIAERIISHMKSCEQAEQVAYAGSLRRRKPFVGDIDVLVSAKRQPKIIDAVIGHFISYSAVKKVISKGESKVQVMLDSGVQVDLRVFSPEQWGSGLLYFTGSKAHNIYMRKIAIKKGFKLNEYGLFESRTGKLIASKTEEDIFEALGLSYVPPEKREI